MSVFKVLALVIIFGLGIFLLVQAFKPNDDNIEEPPPGGIKDDNDKPYELPSEQNTVLINSQNVIYHNTHAQVLLRVRISVTSDWYNSIDQLVRDAYTVFKNANSPQYPTCAENFLYFRNLYYRSVNAGQLLNEAEDRVQQKLNSLHAIRFNDTFSQSDINTILNLQKSLKAFKDVIHSEKIGIWNNIHNLKKHI
jgi:hypothetical protein